MRQLEEIFELLDGIIPSTAEKITMFCEVEKTSYEIFYYAFYEGELLRHSSEIMDSGELDPSEVAKRFGKIADFIRNSDSYDSELRNVITITVEGTTEKIETKQYDKRVGLYKIKKEWKVAHI